MSTFCQAFIAWKILTTPRIRAGVVGHKLQPVGDLYSKLETIIEELPEWFGARIASKKDGRRIKLENNASVTFESAHVPGAVGRGGTRQVLHLTETPQWADEDESMQAMKPVIRDAPGTYVFVETTAKGASGWFHDRFRDGMRALDKGEEPEWVPVFVPWFLTREYRRPRRVGERPLSQSERSFKAKYGLTTEQCLWHRDQCNDLGERVHEEFPSCWEDAFLHSGAPFFRTDAIEWVQSLVKKQGPPIKQGLFRNAGARAVFETRTSGPTHIFEKAQPEHRYSVGVDFASGTASDFNSITVIDWDAEGGGRVVATHRSKLSADATLHEAWLLAEHYNKAVIVGDRTGIGEPVMRRLHEEIHYAHIYLDRDPHSVKYHGGAKRGVAISARQRSGLLDDMATLIHSQRLQIPCGRISDEMRTFVWVTDERAEAEGNNHDDCLFSLALAVRGRDQLPAVAQPVVRHRRPLTSSRTGY